MDAYVRGKRIKLDPARSLGKGGEADVFDLGGGRALKLFKAPDHPDYQRLPLEQKAAEERIFLQQSKLAAFPAGLPPQVVAPEELATDRSGRTVVGYTMRAITPALPLLRYGDPSFRRTGVPSRDVVGLLCEMRHVVSALHAAGVVIGDFNDLNVLVTTGHKPRFIDADSFQFGPYPCSVFSERFVDPLLCDGGAAAPRLLRAYNPDADWYAFAALVMQTLLLVGPYGGVYRPKDSSRRIPHYARPLHRITVFHTDVQYPKPAVWVHVLPVELLEYFHRVFERDERTRPVSLRASRPTELPSLSRLRR
jgi:DNA-binding helix-hairpin-helix protein with protein kinase domain